MVRHHHEDGVLRDLGPQPAHEVVGATIDLLDRVAVLVRQLLLVHGVLGVDEAPHHVGDAVGRLDRGHEQVPVVPLEVLQDDPLAVVEGALAVGQERGLVDAVLVSGQVASAQPIVR